MIQEISDVFTTTEANFIECYKRESKAEMDYCINDDLVRNMPEAMENQLDLIKKVIINKNADKRESVKNFTTELNRCLRISPVEQAEKCFKNTKEKYHKMKFMQKECDDHIEKIAKVKAEEMKVLVEAKKKGSIKELIEFLKNQKIPDEYIAYKEILKGTYNNFIKTAENMEKEFIIQKEKCDDKKLGYQKKYQCLATILDFVESFDGFLDEVYSLRQEMSN